MDLRLLPIFLVEVGAPSTRTIQDTVRHSTFIYCRDPCYCRWRSELGDDKRPSEIMTSGPDSISCRPGREPLCTQQ